jgi:uncharacterized protein YjbI with pentapeptide repeats
LIHRGFTSAVIVSVMVEQKGKQGRKPWTLREIGGKTLWDWLQLLIVPVVLSLITVGFALWQDTRQQRVENQRAEAERELANQRAQDEALQAYLDQMSTLMLDKDLRNSEEDSEVRTLAHARTLTVIRRVDTSRKDEIMQFLLEADLVHDVGGRPAVIELSGADLGGIILRPIADLHGAELFNTDLSGAYLFEANLVGTDLSAADLRGADLREADLTAAGLTGANLRGADLREAKLVGTPLIGADLRGADLKGAYYSSEEQLRQAKSLKGATMPNGQKYEDWLKDR